MASNNNDTAFWVLIFFGLMWFTSHGATSEQTTVRLIVCADQPQSGKCKAKAGPSIQYRASATTQQVVTLNDSKIAVLSGCKVFDHENWSCEEDSMSKGDLFSGQHGLEWGREQVGMLRWHSQRALDWFGGADSAGVTFKDVLAFVFGAVFLVGGIGAPIAAYNALVRKFPRLDAIVLGKEPYKRPTMLPIRVFVCAFVAFGAVALASAVLVAGSVMWDRLEDPRMTQAR